MDIILETMVMSAYICTPVHKYIEEPEGPNNFDVKHNYEQISEFLNKNGRELRKQNMQAFPFINSAILTDVGAGIQFYEMNNCIILNTFCPHDQYSLKIDHIIYCASFRDNRNQIRKCLESVKGVCGDDYNSYWENQDEDLIETNIDSKVIEEYFPLVIERIVTKDVRKKWMKD